MLSILPLIGTLLDRSGCRHDVNSMVGSWGIILERGVHERRLTLQRADTPVGIPRQTPNSSPSLRVQSGDLQGQVLVTLKA